MPAEASAKAGNYRPPLFKLSTYQLINYHLSIITYQPVNLSLINLSTYQLINLSLITYLRTWIISKICLTCCT